MSLTVTHGPAVAPGDPWSLAVGPWAPDVILRRTIASAVADGLAAAVARFPVRVHVAVDIGGDPASATSLRLEVRDAAPDPLAASGPSQGARWVTDRVVGSPLVVGSVLAMAAAAGIAIPPAPPPEELTSWRLAASVADRGDGVVPSDAAAAAVPEPPAGWVRTRTAVDDAHRDLERLVRLLDTWRPAARTLVAAVAHPAHLTALAGAGLDAELVRQAVDAGEVATVAALVGPPVS